MIEISRHLEAESTLEDTLVAQFGLKKKAVLYG